MNQWFMPGAQLYNHKHLLSTYYVLALNCEDPPTESQKPNEQKGGQLTKQKRLKDTTS